MAKLTKMDRALIMARGLALHGVRNTELENFHAGKGPSSATGDYTDVTVVSPYGEIPWNEASRLTDPEMRVLMLSVEEHLTNIMYAFLKLIPVEGLASLDPLLKEMQRAYFGPSGVSWDNPSLSPPAP